MTTLFLAKTTSETGSEDVIRSRIGGVGDGVKPPAVGMGLERDVSCRELKANGDRESG